MVYKPWHMARIFTSEHHELVDREWELTKLLNKVQTEIQLIKGRLERKDPQAGQYAHNR